MADRYKIQNVDASGNKRDEVVLGDDIRVSTGPSGSMTIEIIQNNKVKAKFLNVTGYDNIGPLPTPRAGIVKR